jgi:hypothetical protein
MYYEGGKRLCLLRGLYQLDNGVQAEKFRV